MQQHAIPQQITSYEFKLVGSMTLKQFFRAAAGIILAVLVNKSGLVFFVKWPLEAFFALGGLALAFLPYQDRPLELWIVAFLRSIYSPTVFLYKKKIDKNWMNIDTAKVLAEEEKKKKNAEPLPMKNQEKVKEFIRSLPSVKREEGPIAPTPDTAKLEEVKPTVVELPKVEVVKAEETTPEVETEVATDQSWRNQKAGLDLKTEKLEATGQAVFGAIPMPDNPETPNILVGMVTDNQGKIIDGAIVEIQDTQGIPTRVLKTNSLGQFKTATPLANGRYLVIPEKDGYNFDRVNVDLSGEIVKPIRLISS